MRLPVSPVTPLPGELSRTPRVFTKTRLSTDTVSLLFENAIVRIATVPGGFCQFELITWLLRRVRREKPFQTLRETARLPCGRVRAPAGPVAPQAYGSSRAR